MIVLVLIHTISLIRLGVALVPLELSHLHTHLIAEREGDNLLPFGEECVWIIIFNKLCQSDLVSEG